MSEHTRRVAEACVYLRRVEERAAAARVLLELGDARHAEAVYGRMLGSASDVGRVMGYLRAEILDCLIREARRDP